MAASMKPPASPTASTPSFMFCGGRARVWVRVRVRVRVRGRARVRVRVRARLDVVERVEDAEDVDARGGGLRAEALDHVVGVVGVADGVGAAQQHLKGDVGDLLAQALEAAPRALVQEAHRDVEGGAAPHLHREAALEDLVGRRCGVHQLLGKGKG